MRQLNIHITPEFEDSLNKLMKQKGINTKSEAIRIAVKEALENLEKQSGSIDFRSLVGAGKLAPENKKRKFKTEDDLWE